MCRIPFVKFLSSYVSVVYGFISRAISSPANAVYQKKSQKYFCICEKVNILQCTNYTGFMKFLQTLLFSAIFFFIAPVPVFGQLTAPAKSSQQSEKLQLKTERTTQYVGIGIKIQQEEGYPWIYVRKVLPQGSGYEAGLRNNDQIVRVDGVPVTGKNIHQVARMILGERGSRVALQIKRGNRFMTLEVERRSIAL